MKRGVKLFASALLITGLAAGVSISYSDRSPSEPRYTDCPAYATNPSLFMSTSGQNWVRALQVTESVAGKTAAQDGRVATAPARNNYIDDFIFDKMQAAGVPSAQLCTDEEFIRRVYLDLIGRIPAAEEVRHFLNHPFPEAKRAGLIDYLMDTPEFVDKWTMFLGDLFKNTYGNNTLYYGRTPYYQYLYAAVAADKGWDQVANELITIGLSSNPVNSWQNGRANFFARGWEPMVNQYDVIDNIVVDASRVFLGVPDLCISCHSGARHLEQVNLYLSQQRRQDFWGLAAFFSELRFQRQQESTQPNTFSYNFTKVATTGYNTGIAQARNGIRPPRSGGVFTPNYFFTGETPQTNNWRSEFSRIMRSDPQFNRSAVNYLWKEMMGMGIVDPPDAFDLARQDPNNPPPDPWTIQPTHPELLNALADDFAANGAKLRYILRLIANSSTYQLSAKFNGTWEGRYAQYFARHFARRMTAEQVLDAVYQATGIAGDFTTRDNTPVQWAMQMPDPTEPVNGTEAGATRTFLNTFLRGDRFSQARTPEGSTLQALALMNNAVIQNRVRVGRGGLVDTLIASDMTTDQIIDELFLSTLSRFPSANERRVGQQMINANRSTGTETLQLVLFGKLDGIFY